MAFNINQKYMNKALKIFFLIISLSLVGASCTTLSSSSKGVGAGIYKSTDKAVNWEQKVFVSKSDKGNLTIDNVNVNRIQFSPFDSNALYITSPASGVFYTDNAAEVWSRIFDKSVNSLFIHRTKKDVLYVTSGNKIYKSDDNGKNWAEIYTEATPNAQMVDLVMDYNNTNIVWAISSSGVLLKSLDAGVSWQFVYKFSKAVSRIYLNKQGIMYVAMPSRGIWRSIDGGITWVDTQAVLEKLVRKVGTFRQLTFIPGQDNGFLYATPYGLFKTLNGGDDWTHIELVTPPQAVGINTLAVNPKDTNQIYYAINNIIYYSSDAGTNWITRNSPARQAVTALNINPDDPSVMYLGASRLEK